MNWQALARLLAESEPDLSLALDADRTIVLVTRAARQLLGTELAAAPRLASLLEVACPRLQSFLDGDDLPEGAHLETEAVHTGADGTRRRLSLSIRRLAGDDVGYLCQITRVTPGLVLPRGGDLSYEVDVRDGKPGELSCVTYEGKPIPAPYFAGQACHQLLCARPSACADCPAQRAALAEDDREYTQVSHADGSFDVRSARRTGPTRVAVRTQRIEASTFREIQAARVAQIAREARLSERERQVLEQLLLGSSLADIARALGITPRTAKFHQANLLTKLGADSRADLIRVLG